MTTEAAPVATPETPAAAPADGAPVADAALIAAAEAATEQAPAAPDTKPEGEKAKTNGKPAPAPAEEDIPRLARAMREREQRQAARDEGERAKAELATMRQELQQSLAEAKQAREEAARELARLQDLKRDPIRGIKELGWEPKDLVNRVVTHDTPEGQRLAAYEQRLEQIQAENAELKAWREQQVREHQQRQQWYQQTQRQDVEQKFIATVKEQCPTLSALPEHVVVAWGDRVADEYREKTGQVASLTDIAQYLEHEAKTRLGRATQPAGAKPPSTKAKPRTLTNAEGSERRSAPKPVREMTPTEEHAFLVAAANEALRNDT